MDKEITEICGNSEIIPDFEMIGNDPTFIFTPDPNFNVITIDIFDVFLRKGHNY